MSVREVRGGKCACERVRRRVCRTLRWKEEREGRKEGIYEPEGERQQVNKEDEQGRRARNQNKSVDDRGR